MRMMLAAFTQAVIVLALGSPEAGAQVTRVVGDNLRVDSVAPGGLEIRPPQSYNGDMVGSAPQPLPITEFWWDPSSNVFLAGFYDNVAVTVFRPHTVNLYVNGGTPYLIGVPLGTGGTWIHTPISSWDVIELVDSLTGLASYVSVKP